MTRRNTIQKQLVFNSVKKLMNHPTADEVYCNIVDSYPGISKATVYRNLNHLADEGLLLKISVPGAADKYDASLHSHYHAICRYCSTFIDLTVDNPVKVNLDEPSMKENKVSDFIILFNGVCESCRGVGR
ncbi:MAG: Fur family transcriptional regulator [Saccharofermentanales bacterium]